jgi:hypothetical protein
MPYTMLKFDRRCWKYFALNTSRGPETTTGITEQANTCGPGS